MTTDRDDGSSVTLIFYKIGPAWWREPWLNIVAAAAQNSNFTHVEIALGEEAGQGGNMKDVCRVFNDRVGVEIVERSGRNPQYSYIQLGCTKAAVARMLAYAKTRCVGRPFSNLGMARSILWPRSTDETSFFCAELVAAILKEGNLMDAASNPGAATPEILYRLYQNRAACTANPYVLRDVANHNNLAFTSTIGTPGSLIHERTSQHAAERERLITQTAILSSGAVFRPQSSSLSRHDNRGDSPPRARFKNITSTQSRSSSSQPRLQNTSFSPSSSTNNPPLTITLNSLQMGKR
jgi:hypothetical protein